MTKNCTYLCYVKGAILSEGRNPCLKYFYTQTGLANKFRAIKVLVLKKAYLCVRVSVGEGLSGVYLCKYLKYKI